MKLGVLGTGTIATAVVQGIAADGHDIRVSKRSAANAKMLAEHYDNVQIADNQDIINFADVILLGLMADHARDILPDLQFRPGQKVVSFMAEMDLEELNTLTDPAQASAIVLPFPSIAAGDSPLIMLGDRDLVESLFGVNNRVYALQSPEELTTYLAGQATLSVVARQVEQAAQWMGTYISDPKQADTFLRDLIGSSLRGCESSTALIKDLNTPGGYNQRLRQHMEATGMGEALHKGLDDLSQPK